jgi:hypothetical protein
MELGNKKQQDLVENPARSPPASLARDMKTAPRWNRTVTVFKVSPPHLVERWIDLAVIERICAPPASAYNFRRAFKR